MKAKFPARLMPSPGEKPLEVRYLLLLKKDCGPKLLPYSMTKLWLMELALEKKIWLLVSGKMELKVAPSE